MANRERTKTRTLKVLCSFEPSRMAPACLTDAYECVVPILRRAFTSQRRTETSDGAVSKRRVGGVS